MVMLNLPNIREAVFLFRGPNRLSPVNRAIPVYRDLHITSKINRGFHLYNRGPQAITL